MSECRDSIYVQLAAGFAGGTASAVVTSPLEVLKTRLQSSTIPRPSVPPPQPTPHPPLLDVLRSNAAVRIITTRHASVLADVITRQQGVVNLAKHMMQTEGLRSFFKGLPATIIGVAPARAAYFFTYAFVSRQLTQKTGVPKDHVGVCMCAGFSAGFVNQSVTSPVWFIKTRLQLSTQSGYTLRQCVESTWRNEGITGFYRGLSASYYGTVETMIHFAIYEKLKQLLREHRGVKEDAGKGSCSSNKVWEFAVAAAVSKTIASCCAYPHEVARTRLRQEEGPGARKYRSFFQTLRTVYVEEGVGALYGGLRTQLVRQVFSMAVMFMVYESVLAYNWCEVNWWRKSTD